MNLANTFQQNPARDGLMWSAKCAAVAGLVVLGWLTGQLQTLCILVIVLFVLLQGVIPFCRFAVKLLADMRVCRAEKERLQMLEQEHLDKLIDVDATDGGSILKLLAAIVLCRNRMKKSEAADVFLGKAASEWRELIAPVAAGAEQAPVLGLGGSLLGMLSGVSQLSTAFAGADSDRVDAAFANMMLAMSTMVTTTVAGCFGALVLLGLAAIAEHAVERHMAEIRMIAGLLIDDEYHPEDEIKDTDTLFRRDDQ